MLFYKPHTIIPLIYKEVIVDNEDIGGTWERSTSTFQGLYQPKTAEEILKAYGFELFNAGILLMENDDAMHLTTSDRILIDGVEFSIKSGTKKFTATDVSHSKIIVEEFISYEA